MRTLLTALFFSLISLTATAAIFERDLFEPGDGLLTYDDVNQREWLDLPYTAGLDSAQVLTATQQDGILEGFQFATIDDVTALANSLQISWKAPTPEDSSFLDGTTIPISPGQSPEAPIPSQPRGDSGIAAGKLIHLLGQLFSVREQSRIVTHNLSFVVTDSITYGQISSDSNQEASFTGENVSLLYGSTTIYLGESINSSRSNGAFTTRPSSIFPQATGNNGPFWLYRAAIPEPSTTTLLVLASILTTTTRSRRRSF